MVAMIWGSALVISVMMTAGVHGRVVILGSISDIMAEGL